MTASPASSNSRELLLLCARVRLRPEQQDQLRALLGQGVDWPDLISAAETHAVRPLLCQHLSSNCSNDVPPSQMERLRKSFEQNVRKNLLFANELLRILAEFKTDGIQAMPWKGPALAAFAYGDLGLREFGDLDLLVPQRDIPRARKLLADIGYSVRFQPNLADRFMGQYPFVCATSGLLLELHSELTLRHFPRPIDFSSLIARAISVSFGGSSVPNLAPEDNLILLCMHGAKDLWARLGWVCDISELLQKSPAMDWGAVHARSAALGAGRMVRLGLALAMELLEAELPSDVRARVERDMTAVRLARNISQSMFGSGADPGLAEQFLFRVRTAENLGEGLRYGARLALAPTEEDVMFRQLPKRLWFAYPLLRPIRFLRTRNGAPPANDGASKIGPEQARTNTP